MEKKNYQKPDMRVVMMKHQIHLLDSSPQDPPKPNPGGGSAARSYRWDDDE